MTEARTRPASSSVWFYEVTSESLVLRSNYSPASTVLALDGSTGIVGVAPTSQPAYLAYVDISTNPATTIHTVTLDAGVQGIATIDDLLLVTSTSAVSVVQPPCP